MSPAELAIVPVQQEEEASVALVPDPDKWKVWAKKMRKEAKELSSHIETGYMELGRILYQVWDIPVDFDKKNLPTYKAWGFDTFAEYAEQELGLHRRKAERLRRIWEILEYRLVGMEPSVRERLVKLGWSKVRELARDDILSLDNVIQWVELGETASYPELLASISRFLQEKEAKMLESAVNGVTVESSSVPDPPVPQPEKLFWEHFALYEDQAANIRAALKRAEELSHSEKKGHNLDMICLDFLATNDFRRGDDAQRRRYIAKMEQALGVKLIALDPTTEDVIYGMDTLESMARS